MEDNELFDFRGLRLDWFRLQVNELLLDNNSFYILSIDLERLQDPRPLSLAWFFFPGVHLGAKIPAAIDGPQGAGASHEHDFVSHEDGRLSR